MASNISNGDSDQIIWETITKLNFLTGKFNENVDTILDELNNENVSTAMETYLPNSEKTHRPANILNAMKHSQCCISEIIDVNESICYIVYGNWYKIIYAI